jgi:hypothetical protein
LRRNLAQTARRVCWSVQCVNIISAVPLILVLANALRLNIMRVLMFYMRSGDARL